jgi:hypothetical protein
MTDWLAIITSDLLFLYLQELPSEACNCTMYSMHNQEKQCSAFNAQCTHHQPSLLKASPFTHAPGMQFMLGHVMLLPCAGLCGLDSFDLQRQNQSGMQLFTIGATCMWWKRGSCVHHETLKFSSCMHMIVRPHTVQIRQQYPIGDCNRRGIFTDLTVTNTVLIFNGLDLSPLCRLWRISQIGQSLEVKQFQSPDHPPLLVFFT